MDETSPNIDSEGFLIMDNYCDNQTDLETGSEFSSSLEDECLPLIGNNTGPSFELINLSDFPVDTVEHKSQDDTQDEPTDEPTDDTQDDTQDEPADEPADEPTDDTQDDTQDEHIKINSSNYLPVATEDTSLIEQTDVSDDTTINNPTEYSDKQLYRNKKMLSKLIQYCIRENTIKCLNPKLDNAILSNHTIISDIYDKTILVKVADKIANEGDFELLMWLHNTYDVFPSENGLANSAINFMWEFLEQIIPVIFEIFSDNILYMYMKPIIMEAICQGKKGVMQMIQKILTDKSRTDKSYIDDYKQQISQIPYLLAAVCRNNNLQIIPYLMNEWNFKYDDHCLSALIQNDNIILAENVITDYPHLRPSCESIMYAIENEHRKFVNWVFADDNDIKIRISLEDMEKGLPDKLFRMFISLNNFPNDETMTFPNDILYALSEIV